MQNRNQDLTTYTEQGYKFASGAFNPNGLSAGHLTSKDDDFSFSGFGYNDPKKRRAFTPGTYSIRRGHRRAVGSYNARRWDYNPGAWGATPGWYFTSWWAVKGLIDGFGNTSYGRSLAKYEETNLQTVIYNNAISNLYEDLRGSSLNLALTIGERKESARMLQKAFHAMQRIVVEARRVRRLALRNPSLLISNLWLQAKYGWLPLYQDVYSATEWHYRLFNEMTSKGKARRKVEKDEKLSVPLLYSTRGEKLFRTHECKVNVIVVYGIADSDTYNLSRLTSLNPVSIAWELVPFSFVVDWFYDIGGYLANMEASLGAGLTFKRGMITTLNVHTMWTQSIHYHEYTTPSDYYGYRQRYSDAYAHEGDAYEVTKTRQLLGSFPRPQLPVFQANLGSQRIMSAAALIRQVLLPKKL